MRYLILGAGAIGGYFGGRLVQAGVDTTFLVRPKRQELLAKAGLKIESPLGSFHAQVQTVTPDEVRGSYDVVLLTCKSYDLDAAIEAIRPAVGQGTAILPLLNGLKHVECLNREFGKKQVLGGVARILAAQGPESTILHTGNWKQIVFGEQSGEISTRAIAIQEAFPTSFVEASAVSNIMQKMWEKIVHLAAAAGMACLLRAMIGEIASTPDGSELLVKMFDLNAEIARREGYPPSQEFLDQYHELFRDSTAAYIPSMLRDIEQKNQTEGEHVLGYMLEKARLHGVDDTMLKIACTHLRAYELRRQAGRL